MDEILRCLHSIGTSLIELKHGNSCFLEFKRTRKLNFCETIFNLATAMSEWVNELAYLFFTTFNKLFFSM